MLSLSKEQINLFVKKCIHCGFCKAGCPMYIQFREEKWSARGIIFLTKDLMEGRIKITNWRLLEVVYACSLCNNCYVRCPAKIDTPKIVLELRKMANSQLLN